MPISPSPSPSSFSPSLPSSAPLNTFNTISNPKHRRTLSTIDTEGTGTRNSSLQKIWAEDYYDSDEEGERDPVFEQREIPFGYGLGIQTPPPPPPATLTTRPYPRSIPLSAEEEAYPARQPRTHQRSLTSLLPFLPSAKSRSPERSSKTTRQEVEREREEEDFMPTLTGDKEGVIKVPAPRGGLASWFTGSSAPVSVGIPIMEQDFTPPSTNLSSRDASPERQGAKLRKRPTLASLDSNSSMTPPGRAATPASRFNFFSSPKTPSKTQTIQLPSSLNDDEFLTLDISTALFPSGAPNAQDPFSPAAFKNLLMNAEGLLLKLQTAYKLRTLSLHDLSAEKEAMSEELEEAEMRAKALKSQLEEMAGRVTQSDSTIAELATELAQERQKREDEREARERSIAVIRANGIKNKHHSSGASSLDLSISTKDEDLGFPGSRSNKKWRNRVSAGSELNTEGESDTEEDSVFSRPRSPTVTSSSVSLAPTIDSTPEIMQASFGRVVANPASGASMQRPKTVQQRSTFQKILTGMSSPPVEMKEDPFGEIGMGEEGCSNFRGKDASVAWDTVGLLRAENKGLKERVGCLEDAVDGVLRIL